MKKLLLAFLFFSLSAFGQLGNVTLKHFPGVPTGPCQRNQQAENDSTGDLYSCKAGAWHPAGTSSGTGTVTSVSSGNFSPLFNVTVGTASTTPAFSFSALTAGAHTWLGNPTGVTGAYGFNALTSGDIPNNAANTTGTSSNITGILARANGGLNSNTPGTGILRDGTTPAASELSGDATTSGSNVVTVVKVNGNSVPSGASAHQTIIATASNTFSLKTWPDCNATGDGITYTQTGDTIGCGTSFLTGTLTPAQVLFGSAAQVATGSANLTYASGSGLSQVQGANNTDMFYAKRFTDTTPTGNFFHFQNNAGTIDLFKVDAAGNLTATSFQATNPSGNAGMLSLIQGTAPSAVANAVNFLAPTSVTTYTETLPGTVAAGIWAQDASGNISFGPLSGDVTTSLLTATVAKVHGVTYAATPSTDTTPVITASNTATYTSLPNCGDATHAISYATSTHLFGCQAITATAAPAGSDTQVQYNNSAALGASAAFTFNKTDTLTIGLAGTTLGKLAMAGNTSGATTLVGAAAGGGTWTLRNTTDNVVGANTTDTLTNKSIAGSEINSGTVPAAQIPASLSSTTSVNGTSIPSSSTLTTEVGSTTIALGTSAIASGACGTATTGTITGTATTDAVIWSPNADWSSITGYNAATAGSLILYVWPSASNTVSAKQCNPTASSITPSAATINVRVVR